MKRRIYPKHAITKIKNSKHAKIRKRRWHFIPVFLTCLLLLSALAFMPATPASASSPLKTTLAAQTMVEPTSISSSEAAWIGSFLWWINAPDNNNTVETMASWIAHESPWNNLPPDGAMFTWNPLNTTLPGFGSTSAVNRVGVRIYPSETLGVQALASTIEEPQYHVILQNLRWSVGLCGQTYSELALWSGNGYDQVC